ncbi:MAG: response regulator [Verrucomicrobiales bacterium]|nr:response regulator [Verrucomicrobiales bacterium]
MKRRRILVVDDERIVAQDIMEVLLHMGCEVVGTALSGREAIDKAGALQPDLILMDITLQGEMDGVEAAAIIRRNLDIPCVFLTAYSDSKYLERAKLTMPAGYMVKPFEEAGLRSTVEIALYKVDLERALKESNDWLQTTLMSIGDGVIATTEQGLIRFMNPLAEQLTGWNSAEAEGRGIEEVFPIANEYTRQRVANPALEAVRTARVTNLAEGTVLQRRNGEVIPIDDSGAPILNHKQEVVGAVLVFRDITERRAAEREVRRHQEHLEELVQERTGEIRKTNQQLLAEIDERRRAEHALSYRASRETLLASISATFLRSKSSEVDQAVESALSRIGAFMVVDRCYLLQVQGDTGSLSCTHEWIMARVPAGMSTFQNVPLSALPLTANPSPGGGALVISHHVPERREGLLPHLAQARGAQAVLLVQLAHGEEVLGFLGIDSVSSPRQWQREDASLLSMAADPLVSALRRRRMEEEKVRLQGQLNQSQKMEAVGKLSSGIAHDFNNMLLPIIGYADMILGRLPAGDPNIHELREIRRAAQQAATLTRQLLSFSRKQVVKKSIFDLNEAIQSSSDMLRRIIGEDVKMEMDLAPDLLAVQADAGQVEQVVMNLCVNARDAMPGGGRLTIRTANVDPGRHSFHLLNSQQPSGEYVRISVTDTGAGIAPELLDRIFEPFFTTKGIEGTGLGLSVIYAIIQEHGGGLEIESAVGRGTTVHVYLPGLRGRVPKPVQPAEEPAGGSASMKGTGQRVLLVEDEEAVNRLVRTALSGNGYQVTSANCVRDAVEKFDANAGQFDMIFSDAVLPDGNGVDLISVFRDRNPSLRVLLSSGYTDRSHLMETARQHQISFLPKPYTLPKLFQTVAEVMQDQRSHMLV